MWTPCEERFWGLRHGRLCGRTEEAGACTPPFPAFLSSVKPEVPAATTVGAQRRGFWRRGQARRGRCCPGGQLSKEAPLPHATPPPTTPAPHDPRHPLPLPHATPTTHHPCPTRPPPPTTPAPHDCRWHPPRPACMDHLGAHAGAVWPRKVDTGRIPFSQRNPEPTRPAPLPRDRWTPWTGARVPHHRPAQ